MLLGLIGEGDDGSDDCSRCNELEQKKFQMQREGARKATSYKIKTLPEAQRTQGIESMT